MDTLDVRLILTNLHCFEEGDGIGSAEPYLWTVFFKIDGNTCSVTLLRHLQGTATVSTRPGNHRDLPNHDVDAGENVPIPTTIGQFLTRLEPIPLQHPLGGVTEIGGFIGAVTLLLEEDDTPNSVIANAHLALDRAVRNALNDVIPRLSFNLLPPGDAEIDLMKQQIRNAILFAIKTDAGVLGWRNGPGNMDDVIGVEVFRFSHNELAARGQINFQRRFKHEGDWELQGRVTAVPEGPKGALRVVINGIREDLAVFPVHVTGPGFSRFLGKTQTITNLVPGTYTVTAIGFEVAHGKPQCTIFSADVPTQHATVTANQVTSVTVDYTPEPCDLEDTEVAESENMS